MKNKFLGLLTIVLATALMACSKNDPKPTIDIPTQFESVNFGENDKTHTITFEANQPWTASVVKGKSGEVSWLSVTPESGKAGEVTLTLTSTDSYLQSTRTAYVNIEIDGASKSIAVMQVPGIPTLEDDEAAASVPPAGFYVANEDWFGHSNGTVNYFAKDGSGYAPSYRVYRAANSGAELGVTTQFATIWGDYAYFCSKQGNRFVVADAKTMKKKAVLETIGGDGRTFVGISTTKGYIGHSKGVVTFDIANLALGKVIDGISGQIGNMCVSGGRAFIIGQKALYIVNTETDELEQTVAGSYNTLARSKDGDVWVATSSKFVRYNPETLESEEVDYPAGATVGSSWGAWNAGSLCASTQTNTLYWVASGSVIKFDVDTRSANTALYKLGKDVDDDNKETQLAIYGAGLRVDPLTDELILTIKFNGWGAAGAYNWIYKLNNNGQEITHFAVKGDDGSGASWAGDVETWGGKYFWFPAMPFFEDANKPQILLNQIALAPGEEQEIDLTEKIVDYDNTMVSILKSVKFADDNIITGILEGNKLTVKATGTPGSTSTCTLTVISNGVQVEKTVRLDVVDNN